MQLFSLPLVIMIVPHVRSFARFRLVSLGLLAALLAAGAACDRVPLTAPSGSEITLFTNTTTVPLNGSADIVATVTENGGTLVHNGTLVTFTTTLGTMDPPEARTHNGQVTVRLRTSTQSGVAVVQAFSGGIQSGDELEISVGAASVDAIVLSPLPSTVPGTGGTVTLLAVVVDEVGNGVPGIPVTFVASQGTLSASRVLTNAEGEASTTLTTNRETTVRATSGAVQSEEVTITVRAVPRITVQAPTGLQTVGQPVSFTVTTTVETGGAPIRSVSVDYGDGTSDSLGSLTGSTTVQHVYRSPGTYRVTATVTDVAGERGETATTVVIQAAQQPTLTLTLPVGNVTRGAPFTATVTAANVPPGVNLVSTTFDFTDGQPPVTVNGTSTTYAYGSAGTFSVIATARFSNNTTASAQGVVRVVP